MYNTQALLPIIESVIENQKLLRNLCNHQISLIQSIKKHLLGDYKRARWHLAMSTTTRAHQQVWKRIYDA